MLKVKRWWQALIPFSISSSRGNFKFSTGNEDGNFYNGGGGGRKKNGSSILFRLILSDCRYLISAFDSIVNFILISVYLATTWWKLSFHPLNVDLNTDGKLELSGLLHLVLTCCVY